MTPIIFPISTFLSAHALSRAVFLVLFIFGFSTGIVFADWNSGVTIEDVSTRIAINIVDDGVQVTVDLSKDAVDKLQADNTDNALDDSEKKAILEAFSKSAIKIKTEKQLIPIIKTVGDSTNDTESASNAESAYIREVFFPFSDVRPEQLFIAPVFKVLEKTGKKYLITVAHFGLPVIDHGVLTEPESLQLNWQDPWYSHFLNPKLQRGHSDPVMAFLYIEPRQIKSEIVVRVKEMANWARLGLRDGSMIYPDEYASIKLKVGQFLLAQNKVSADAKLLKPTLERVDFIRMGAADIQAYQPQKAQRQNATLIGVSISYQTQEIPSKVQWRWNLFNKKIQRVAIRAYDPAGLFDSYVTPEYRNFEWENMLSDIDLPEISDQLKAVPVGVDEDQDVTQYYWLIGLIGLPIMVLISSRFISPGFRKSVQFSAFLVTFIAAYVLFQNGKLSFPLSRTDLDERQAKPLIKQLLWNIYQAFESTQEDLAYDKLAYSVSGELREQLYLQNRRMFLVENGGLSKVKSIEIKSLVNHSSLIEEGFLFDCEWLVAGEVVHWGHQHRRENLYRASIKIVPTDGVWKIVQMESTGQQRLDGSET